MDTLPNEILLNIYSFLSHKNIGQCALACKNLYIATQRSSLYHTIKIYSKTQLEKFIKIATIHTINNQRVGHLVQSLTLNNNSNQFPTTLKMEEIKELYQVCPNIYSLEIVNIRINSMIPQCYWLQLTNIPKWLTQYDNEWYQRIYDNHELISSLEFTLKDELFQRKKKIRINKKATIDDELLKPLCLSINKQQLFRQKINEMMIIQLYFIQNRDMFTETIDQIKYVCYYKNIISFSPLFSSSLHHLKYLSIDFSTYLLNNLSLKLDEQTIDAILQPCPSLVSLILISYPMNISYKYTQSVSSSSSSLFSLLSLSSLSSSSSLIATTKTISHPSLKNLTFNNGKLQHYEFFDYITKKCPQLTTINMKLKGGEYIRYIEENKEKFRLAIYNMISNLSHLTELRISNLSEHTLDYRYLVEGDHVMKNTIWPIETFPLWLHQHSTQLKVLEYPLELSTIERKNNEKGREPLSSPPSSESSESSYLNYLTTLIIKKETNLMDTFTYFTKYIQNNHTTLSSITTLTLGLAFYNKHNIENFNIFPWLNLFPNLKRLTLESIANIICEDTNIFINQQQQKQHYHYGLKELVLEKCGTNAENGINKLCQLCPSIRLLKLIKVTIRDSSTSIKHIKVLDLPHLVLDDLYMVDVYPNGSKMNAVAPYELTVNQSYNNNSPFIYTLPGSRNCMTVKMAVNCRFVDHVHLKSD